MKKEEAHLLLSELLSAWICFSERRGRHSLRLDSLFRDDEGIVPYGVKNEKRIVKSEEHKNKKPLDSDFSFLVDLKRIAASLRSLVFAEPSLFMSLAAPPKGEPLRDGLIEFDPLCNVKITDG